MIDVKAYRVKAYSVKAYSGNVYISESSIFSFTIVTLCHPML